MRKQMHGWYLVSSEQLRLTYGKRGGRRKGEVFDRQRHVSGTEVKAITYSAMDVREQGDDVEVFVIVDI